MPENTATLRKHLTTRSLRFLLSLLVVLAGAVSISVATPHAAQAATPPPPPPCVSGSGTSFTVHRGCASQRIPGAHACANIGPSTGATTAVQCADLYATDTTGGVELWGEGEFYCQGASPQCAGMNVNIGFSYTDLDTGAESTGNPRNYTCNPTVGACSNGGKAEVSTAHSSVPQDCFQLYSWEPVGNVISVKGVSGAYHSMTENRSLNIQLCLD
jgi:hypothetical protein